MDRMRLNELIKSGEPGYVISALFMLYEYQEFDEQINGTTAYRNNVGFNGVDAPFLSDMVLYYNSHGYLTNNQLCNVRKMLVKYTGQLVGKELVCLPFKQPETKPADTKTFLEPDKEVRPVLLAEKSGEEIRVSFPYSPDLISKIKTLSGRKWNPADKSWRMPFSHSTIKSLKEWGFVCTPKLLDWASSIQEVKRTVNRPSSIDWSVLNTNLFQYQREGVEWLEQKDGRGLIADDMGLGKTAQALSYLQLHPEIRPAVIVCPASLKLNWAREVKMWVTKNRSVHIIEGKSSKNHSEFLPESDIYIINYDILATKDAKNKTICRSDIVKLKPEILITDEAHYWKSDSQRAKAVMNLAKQVPRVIPLTGTPVLNKPMEIFNILHTLEKDIFPSKFKFGLRYCDGHHNGYGWDFNGASNISELHELINGTIMLRRAKDEVLKQLPHKQRIVVPFEISNRKIYQHAEADFIGWIKTVFGKNKAEKAKQAEALVKIEGLKQIAVKGKIADCIEWINNFLESGKKLVVFANHKEVIEGLMTEYKGKAVKVDGSVKGIDRQKAVDLFQTQDSIKLFIGNIQAAGVGITLTAASDVCFIELGWHAGIMDQAEDRIHRIGQTSDNVTAWYLLAADTIEEYIAGLIDSKRKTVTAILDGKEVDDSAMLGELLKKYGE